MLHFELQEFDSPDLQNSGINMDASFLRMLDDARGIAGISFNITSGYRTKERNKLVGGVVNSSHLIGKASDISVKNGQERYIILNALIKAGFRRLGVSKFFIHCDNDETKRESLWTY